ncbi:MAG: hypothetical protein ACE5FI_18895, partial [Anaerolineales bacterium]
MSGIVHRFGSALIWIVWALWWALPVQAQSASELESLTVELWPEYDQPAMLVIYRGQLAAHVALPAQLAFRLPIGVPAPNAVAYFDAGSQSLRDASYTLEAGNDGATVVFTVPTATFQFEYYDFSLDRSQPERAFSFQWPGDFSVANLVFKVQQPAGVTDFTLTPAATSAAVGGDSLAYHTVAVGNAVQGEVFQLDIAYVKTDDRFAVGLDTEPPVESPATFVAGDGKSAGLAFAIIGGVLLLGGAFMYWQFRPTSPDKRRRPPRPARNRAGTAKAQRYCHMCGQPSGRRDRFCRACGA